MKKVFSLLVVFIMLLSAVSISAEEIEEFYFDSVGKMEQCDDMSLMEDVYAELESRLTEGWANLESRIVISDLKIEKTDITAMYAKVFFKNPYYYYVNRNFGGATVKGETYMGYVTPNYSEANINVIKDNWAKIDSAVEEILSNTDGMTDCEKVLAVHEYMADNYTYDENGDANILVMINKKGNYVAFSYAFVHMMNVLGIESAYMDANMGYYWNLVYVDSKAVVRLYNNSALPLWVISNGDSYMIKHVNNGDTSAFAFDNGEEQTIYVWNANMQPVIEKVIVK